MCPVVYGKHIFIIQTLEFMVYLHFKWMQVGQIYVIVQKMRLFRAYRLFSVVPYHHIYSLIFMFSWRNYELFAISFELKALKGSFTLFHFSSIETLFISVAQNSKQYHCTCINLLDNFICPTLFHKKKEKYFRVQSAE